MDEQKMDKMSTAAIILTMNQREMTLQCLSSLLALQAVPFQVIVWDNASQDGTAEAIRAAYPEVLVHHHPTNLGVAGGRNEAARLAIETFQPAYLLFLDNDMLFEPGFIEALRRPFAADQTLGQTQAKLRFMHDRERLNDGGGANINFLLWQITPVGYNEIDQGQYDTPTPCIACGGAMMVRTELFQALGGFDMTFNPFGPEDLDFSLRLQKAGYRALYVPEAVAYHVVSHTFGKGYSEDYARHKSRHWFTFMRRHASLAQQLGFFLFGAPYMAGRVVLREGKKGNLGALRGLFQGGVDYFKTLLVARRQG
ncbi:MAG: glycosyltransferase family 2 protein [Anaerolineae bacterium]|nr:glycosyltransferase family 2 protein [Anaerolineae bacterium]